MTRFRNLLAGSTSLYLASALPALAQGWDQSFWGYLSRWMERRSIDVSWSGGETAAAASVPEIDASSGLIAVAAVAAMLALAWELNRRRQRA